jgi:leucyl aminopeptidase
MEFKIQQKAAKKHHLYIIDDAKKLNQVPEITVEENTWADAAFASEQTLVTVNQYSHLIFIYLIKNKKTASQAHEACRKAGAEMQAVCNKHKLTDLTITNFTAIDNAAILFAEGLALANYQFLKYRTEAKKIANTLQHIYFTKESATVKEVAQLNTVIDAIYRARTLVNEPLSYLSATQLSHEIVAMGKVAGFKVTVLNKARIEKEKMGGLLSVNRGSQDPPTFTIMEYVPKKALNKKPIVLVGKGVVYDTGGVSLKPTLNSMDRMKSDMGGAALVSCAMYAIAKLQLPLHVIALAPATDNRPGENAYVPGDVVTMMSGTTVEVLNTDAEGRMILGDALHWAKRYKPELVIDFATLTGAASAAVGEHGSTSGS